MLHGPEILPNGQVRFRLWAPSVGSVSLALVGRTPEPMLSAGRGWFEVVVPAEKGDSYCFVLPDGMEVPDPASRAQLDDIHGPSVVVDSGAYEWRHRNWRNRPWHEAVIYELHVGALGGFPAVRQRLAEYAALGVTAIELMPVAAFPGQRSWGYDGVLPFAPDNAYGTPDDLRALVDEAHGLGLMVFLDVVYNHFGPDGAYLHVYAKEFFDEGVHTPWGAAIDFKLEQVREFFIQNALMWLNEYRFDGLRFDAAHAISPPGFLPDLAARLRAKSDHSVHLVLEHEGNKSSLLKGPEAGLFDAQWADDWHHCLHVLLTGEKEGYYESFQQPAEQLSIAMADGFVFQGQISPHHNEARGEPSGALPSSAFVICLQNHDQVGNRAMGERLTQLADPRALRAATALLLLSPNIPLLFMGEETGSTSPFLFFTDHHDELAELVRIGRRREFAHFAAFQDEARRELIPDPNAVSTFSASIPQPGDAEATLSRDFYRGLLAIRHKHVVPGIVGCRSAGARALASQAVLGTWQLGTGVLLSLAANFGAEAAELPALQGEVIFATGEPRTTSALAPFSMLAVLTRPA